jgi:hypothetical protein
MARGVLAAHHFLVDPLAIVENQHAELSHSVVNRDGNSPCVCVLERVAKRLARDPVSFLTNDRVQIAREGLRLARRSPAD